jgi:hypothetical protein
MGGSSRRSHWLRAALESLLTVKRLRQARNSMGA